LSDQIPEAPRVIAFRNRLAHGYADVADDIVWAIAKTEVPALRRQVSALLVGVRDDGP
jgi:uncharacterized protein with HEPN domain